MWLSEEHVLRGPITPMTIHSCVSHSARGPGRESFVPCPPRGRSTRLCQLPLRPDLPWLAWAKPAGQNALTFQWGNCCTRKEVSEQDHFDLEKGAGKQMLSSQRKNMTSHRWGDLAFQFLTGEDSAPSKGACAANAGDTGSIPGPGRSHMQQSN